MAYRVDDDMHLDLSECYRGFNCDLLLAADISREYYFAEMQGMIAWDGTRISGLEHVGTWEKLVSKHRGRTRPFNPLQSLDLNRAVRLPVLKAVVTGRVDADVYRNTFKGKDSVIQAVVSGVEKDYVVVLGVIKGSYVLRTAYPGDEGTTHKIRDRGTLIERIRT